MTPDGAPVEGPRRTRALLEALLRSDRPAKLCAELAGLTGAPGTFVEDSFQEACELLWRGKGDGQSMGEVYNWLWRTTLRRVQRKRARAPYRRELPVGSMIEDDFARPLSPAAEDEVIGREKQRELSALVSTALAGMGERERQVVALNSHDLRGREVAQRLSVSERTVKRLTKRGLAGMREALVESVGGGCETGERLVSRLSFGLANAGERFEAQAHMASCDQCAALYRRLDLVHEKIAALVPVPAAVEADPGLLERVADRTADALAEAKQQATDTVGLAKQHATASYARAVEYSPLATARPGAAATAIAGCLALAGGTATYCVENNLNPITGFANAEHAAPEKRKTRPPAEETRVAQELPDPPQLPAIAEPEPAPPPTPTPEPAPAAPPPPAPPPAEPTPPAVQFGEPATVTPAPAPPPPKPAPVPASGGSDLYGP